MEEKEQHQPSRTPPKAGAGDVAHTIVRAGLQLVPAVGGAAAELFSAVVTPPLTKRRDEWMASIGEGLKHLEERVQNFRLEDLAQNEAFVTTAMHATQVALRNHHQEKLEALRNAVLNSALPTAPEDDIQLILLEYVDTLTPWHLRILALFDDPAAWSRKHGITYPDWHMGGPSAVLEHAYPELRGRRAFYDPLVRDLYQRGLLGIESLHTTMTGRGMLESRTTQLGKQLLGFISSPLAGG